MHARLLVSVLLILSLLVGGIAPGAVAAQEDTSDDGPVVAPGDDTEGDQDQNQGSGSDSDEETPGEEGENQAESDSSNREYSLSDLRDSGMRFSNSPSVRITDTRMYWAVQWPADKPFTTVGDSNWQFLESGDQVGRNTIHLRTTRVSQEPETRTVNIVYWEEKQVTRTGENQSTTTETVPHVIAEDTVQVEWSQQGIASQPIDLRKNTDEVQVTMWFDDAPDAKWQFSHKSMKTTEAMNIDTVGAYLMTAAQDFFVPLGIGVFISGLLVRGAIKRAGAGPGWGFMPWIIAIAILLFLIVTFWYESTANLIAGAPHLLAGAMILLITVVMLETYEDGVSKVLCAQPRKIYPWKKPTGKEGIGMNELGGETYKVANIPDRGQAIIKTGVLPFLARALGYCAEIENLGEIESVVEMPDSNLAEKAWYIDAEADDLVEYKQEGWHLDIPEFKLENLGNIVVQFGIAIVGMWAATTALPGIWAFFATGLAVAIAFVRPHDGYARINPAPAHAADAHANQMQINKDLDDLDTLQQARTGKWKAESKHQKEVEEMVDDRDSTLIEEMHGETSKRSVIADVDEGDDEQNVSPGDDDDEDDEKGWRP